MMNRKSLMISTMLMSAVGVGGVVGFAENAWAQCATEDCATLGYTEAYNSSGNCLKCPFGDAYNCEAGYICPEGYTQECTGTGEVAVGEACNGKYTKCVCKEGYHLVDGVCFPTWENCSGLAVNCSLGDILFSDGTCSDDVVEGKTPIAVVVYKSGNCGQAMALNSVNGGTTYKWSTEDVDISGLTNYTSSSTASTDFASCKNSAKIRAQGNSSKYPAVWAAYNYTTKGTEAGDWCLPAAGIITSACYQNEDSVNEGFSRVGGEEISNAFSVWSSTERTSDLAWTTNNRHIYCLANYGRENFVTGKSYVYEVRPVIEF